MKRYLSLFLMFFFWTSSAIAWKSASPPPQTKEEKYHHRLQHYEILTRSEDDYEGSKGKVWSEGLIDAPPEKVWEVAMDANHWHHFLPNMAESKVVSPELSKVLHALTPQERLQSSLEEWRKKFETMKRGSPQRRKGGRWDFDNFEILSFPWPVGDRWYVNHIDADETGRAQGRYRRDFHLMMGQLKYEEGYWEIATYEKNPSKTHLKIYMQSDPGIPVPAFMIKIGNHVVVPDIIRSMRNEVKRRSS